MRADGRTLADIATALGVSKSSVSVWVRDVEFEPQPRRASAHPAPTRPAPRQARRDRGVRPPRRRTHRRALRRCLPRRGHSALRRRRFEDRQRGELRQYRPGDGCVLLRVASALLRHRRVATPRPRVSARRPRPRRGRDVLVGHHRRAARRSFGRRTEPKPIRRSGVTKHENGCVYVRYCCARTLREIMGLVRALLASEAIPG